MLLSTTWLTKLVALVVEALPLTKNAAIQDYMDARISIMTVCHAQVRGCAMDSRCAVYVSDSSD
jgi:hypothetical protein